MVVLLIIGNGTYPRLFEELRRAEKLITWFVFWYREGDLADEVREILCERAEAGVTVLFLYQKAVVVGASEGESGERRWQSAVSPGRNARRRTERP